MIETINTEPTDAPIKKPKFRRISWFKRILAPLLLSFAAVYCAFLLLAGYAISNPHLSHWESPSEAGVARLYWQHSLRPWAKLFVTFSGTPEALTYLGLFDDDDIQFDATFHWSQDGQVIAARDMPQWYFRIPEDPNGNEVKEAIFTHAYDFSTGTAIGYSETSYGNATQFLERHRTIVEMMSNHGGIGESFTVADIRASERKMGYFEWQFWRRKEKGAHSPY